MKKLLAVMLSVIMVFSFAACAGKSANNEGESQTEETTTIRIGAMAGPTAMGMVKLRKDSENGNTKNTYAFEDFATDASAFVTPLATGEIDIAAVPSNLAANIYNKTEGKVQVVAVNTLGVLNLVERGNTVNSISDLKGKTIYATGMGAVPEYTIRYILSGNGLDADKDVNIVWCSDTTEALSKLKSEDGAIAVLPQPFVTAASAQISDLRVVTDLNESWEKINNNSKIVTGVIVVRKEFAEKYPEQLKKFIDEYNESVAYTSSNVDEASGIALATICAQAFGVPMVFAKKAKSDNIEGGLYQSDIYSYTYKKKVTLLVSKEWLSSDDKVLIIDDFMANGEAMRGLCDIVTAAGATLLGIGCAVEKGFQGGGDRLRAAGVNLKSLAIIESAEPGNIVFRDDD